MTHAKRLIALVLATTIMAGPFQPRAWSMDQTGVLDFTNDGTVANTNLKGSVIDRQRRFAYLGTDGAAIVKVDLATMKRVDAISLNADEAKSVTSAAIDAANGRAYFGTLFGNVVKTPQILEVDITDPTFKRLRTIPFTTPGGFNCAAIDNVHHYAYFAAPFVLVRVNLNKGQDGQGQFTVDKTLDIAAQSLLVDEQRGLVYVGVGPANGLRCGLMKMTLDLKTIETRTLPTLPSDPDSIRLTISAMTLAAIDATGTYAYYAGANDSSRQLVQVNLQPTLSWKANLNFPSPDYIETMVLDSTQNHLCVGFHYNGQLQKIRQVHVSATGLHQTDEDSRDTSGRGFMASVIDPARGRAYFAASANPGTLHEVDLATFSFTPAIARLRINVATICSARFDPLRKSIFYVTRKDTVAQIPSVVFELDAANFFVKQQLILPLADNPLQLLLDPAAGFGYLPDAINKQIIKISLPTLTVAGRLPLAATDMPTLGAIDVTNKFAYFATTAKNIIKVSVDPGPNGFYYVDRFPVPEGAPSSIVVDPVNQYGYIYVDKTVVKMDLHSPETRLAAVTINAPPPFSASPTSQAFIDASGSTCYFVTDHHVVRVKTNPTLTVDPLLYEYDNLYGADVDFQHGYGYVSVLHAVSSTIRTGRLQMFNLSGSMGWVETEDRGTTHPVLRNALAVDPVSGFGYSGVRKDFTSLVQFSLGPSSVGAPQITTSSPLPDGMVNAAYSRTLAASGGKTPYAWSVSAGILPAGLSLNSTTGVLSGTPTTAGNANFTIKVTDANTASATKAFALTVNAALSVTTPSPLPDGMLNAAYSQTLAASGGKTPYAWSLSAGALPAGLSLNSTTGALTGTPTATGAFNFTIKVTDANTASSAKAFTLTVSGALSITTSSPLPDGMLNTAYSQTLAASGGKTPYAWSVSVGALPAGLSLNSTTGVLSGTPTTAGNVNFTIKVTDANTASATKSCALTVNGALAITTNSPLPDGMLNTAYSQTLAASGGKTPYAWSVSAGALPAGLSLNSITGVLSGTPTTAGNSNFTIKVTDANTASATKVFALTVNGGLAITTPSPLPDGMLNTAYSQTLAASGGKTPYAWSVSAGALPAGLSLNSITGVLSGTPTTAGNSNFTIKVTDANTASATKAFALTVSGALAITTPSPLPDGMLNTAYSQTLAASGGKTPYAWSVYAGALPAGLSLNSTTGALTGTPTATGASNFTIKVTDANTASATKAIALTVSGAFSITTPSSLPEGTAGNFYSQTFAASGGNTPYSWSVSAGALPAGLNLNSTTGVLAGVITSAGNANFTIKVTDATTASATKVFSLIINPALSITTSSPLPDGMLNTFYSQTFAASGGKTPYIWSVSAGALPAGLSLNSTTGALTGSPTAAGVFSFRIKIDAIGASKTKFFALTIKSAQVNSSVNRPPALDGPPTASINGLIVTFTAMATDPEGDPIIYAWKFGDGNGGFDATTTHVYSQPGTYTILLTVRDTAMNSTPTTLTITLTTAGAFSAVRGGNTANRQGVLVTGDRSSCLPGDESEILRNSAGAEVMTLNPINGQLCVNAKSLPGGTYSTRKGIYVIAP